MPNIDYVKALGLDYWYLKEDALLLCVPDAVFNEHLDKQVVDVLCLCPKHWQFDEKIQTLLNAFLNTMYFDKKLKIIYSSKSIDSIEKQLKYNGNLILNFTQSACKDASRVIKINSTTFEAMLEKPELKKQVMLDVL